MENKMKLQTRSLKKHKSSNMEALDNLLYEYKLNDAQIKMLNISYLEPELYEKTAIDINNLIYFLDRTMGYFILDVKVNRFITLLFTKRFTKYSNTYIAKKLNVNRKTISRMIKILVKNGFITKKDNSYTYVRVRPLPK